MEKITLSDNLEENERFLTPDPRSFTEMKGMIAEPKGNADLLLSSQVNCF